MDDLISRAAVVDTIEGVDWYHQNQHGEMVHGANPDEHQAWYKAEDIYKAIESVPSAQQWIPCSERLPSFDFTDVLVCMHDVQHGCEDKYYIASAYVVRGHWEMTLNVDTSDLEIVAWMPLPKPWKGGEE